MIGTRAAAVKKGWATNALVAFLAFVLAAPCCAAMFPESIAGAGDELVVGSCHDSDAEAESPSGSCTLVTAVDRSQAPEAPFGAGRSHDAGAVLVLALPGAVQRTSLRAEPGLYAAARGSSVPLYLLNLQLLI